MGLGGHEGEYTTETVHFFIKGLEFSIFIRYYKILLELLKCVQKSMGSIIAIWSDQTKSESLSLIKEHLSKD